MYGTPELRGPIRGPWNHSLGQSMTHDKYHQIDFQKGLLYLPRTHLVLAINTVSGAVHMNGQGQGN